MQFHATAAFEGFKDHVLGVHLAGALLVWVAQAQLTMGIMTSRVPAYVLIAIDHISCY